MLNIILRRLGIRPSERRMVGRLFWLHFALIASYTLSRATRDAVFLAKHRAQLLPYLYIALAFFTAPGRTGITDTTDFDMATFDESWGRWGAGLVFLFPTGRDGLSAEKWAVGPVLGFVSSRSFPGWNAGLFLQSYFSFAGDDDAPRVGVLNLQPILSHQLGGGRSVSLGSSQLVYDTANSRWASVQFGLNYSQIVTAFGHKWRPNVEAGYEFRDLAGNPKWTIRAGLTLLLPTN